MLRRRRRKRPQPLALQVLEGLGLLLMGVVFIAGGSYAAYGFAFLYPDRKDDIPEALLFVACGLLALFVSWLTFSSALARWRERRARPEDSRG